MNQRTLFFSLALVAFTISSAADPLPSARPESVGLSSERLERIGQVLRADIERGRLPGAVMAIARPSFCPAPVLLRIVARDPEVVVALGH